MSADDAAELAAWRALHGPLLNLTNRVLAAQGDHAEPDLIALQHQLASMPAVFAGEQSQSPQ